MHRCYRGSTKYPCDLVTLPLLSWEWSGKEILFSSSSSPPLIPLQGPRENGHFFLPWGLETLFQPQEMPDRLGFPVRHTLWQTHMHTHRAFWEKNLGHRLISNIQANHAVHICISCTSRTSPCIKGSSVRITDHSCGLDLILPRAYMAMSISPARLRFTIGRPLRNIMKGWQGDKPLNKFVPQSSITLTFPTPNF